MTDFCDVQCRYLVGLTLKVADRVVGDQISHDRNNVIDTRVTCFYFCLKAMLSAEITSLYLTRVYRLQFTVPFTHLLYIKHFSNTKGQKISS